MRPRRSMQHSGTSALWLPPQRRLCRSSSVANLPEAGATEFLAEIFTFHLDDAAHFVQPRAHPLPDAVSKALRSRGRPHSRTAAIHAGRGLILEVRRNDGCAIVVIARVKNQADRIPNPFRRFYGAQLIEHQDVGFKHGTKHVQFGSLNRAVVGILNFLQQLTVVVKQAGNALVEDEFLRDRNRQMSLAGANLADNQKSGAISRIVLLSELGSGEMSQR